MSWVNFDRCLCQECSRGQTCKIREVIIEKQKQLIQETRKHDPKHDAIVDFCVFSCLRFEKTEKKNVCGV